MEKRVWVSAMSALLMSGLAQGAPVQWATADGGNDHYYEVVSVPSGITWENARERALREGGNLATLQTDAEAAFVIDLAKASQFWYSQSSVNIGPWLGGYKAKTSGNWHWLTGEAISNFNWLSGGPNPLTNEDYIHLASTATDSTSKWNSANAELQTASYVVEYKTKPKPSVVGSGNLQYPLMLLCKSSYGNIWVMELHGYDTPGTNHGLVYAHQSAGYRSITYNMDGNYVSHAGDALPGCVGKSLSTLAEEGVAIYMK